MVAPANASTSLSSLISLVGSVLPFATSNPAYLRLPFYIVFSRKIIHRSKRCFIICSQPRRSLPYGQNTPPFTTKLLSKQQSPIYIQRPLPSHRNGYENLDPVLFTDKQRNFSCFPRLGLCFLFLRSNEDRHGSFFVIWSPYNYHCSIMYFWNSPATLSVEIKFNTSSSSFAFTPMAHKRMFCCFSNRSFSESFT